MTSKCFWSDSRCRPYWQIGDGSTTWEAPALRSKAAAAFEPAAEHASTGARMLRQESNRFKEEMFGEFASGTVLDLGCGRGGDFGKAKRAGASKIIGIDACPLALEEACKRNALTFKMPLTLCCANLEDEFPFAQPVDSVAIMFALHHFNNKIFDCLKHVLSKQGVIFGIVPDAKSITMALRKNTRFGATPELTIKQTTAGYLFQLQGLISQVEEKFWFWDENLLQKHGFFLTRLQPCVDAHDCGIGLYSKFVITRVQFPQISFSLLKNGELFANREARGKLLANSSNSKSANAGDSKLFARQKRGQGSWHSSRKKGGGSRNCLPKH